MNKKKIIRGLKYIFKKSGKYVDNDLIDWKSEVDSELTFSENYEILKKKYLLSFWDRW